MHNQLLSSLRCCAIQYLLLLWRQQAQTRPACIPHAYSASWTT